MFRYRMLFCGVNQGVASHKQLKFASEDAENVSNEFSNCGMRGLSGEVRPSEYVSPSGNKHELQRLIRDDQATKNTIQTALDDLRGDSEDVDLLLIFFSGHMVHLGSSYFTFTLNTKTLEDREGGMIDITAIVRTLVDSPARNRVLILDTCHAGAAAEVARTLVGRTSVQQGQLFVAAACGPNAAAYEGKNGGFFTHAFLKNMSAARKAATKSCDLSQVLKATCDSMEDRRASYFQLGSSELNIPVHKARKSSAPKDIPAYDDPLQQSMGHAIEAFRNYLNDEVVEGVELLYFLSYDIWDGSLIYDGLIPDSIEQLLIDYIRSEFLDRNRLRSRFEQSRVGGEGLGPAGRCFENALQSTGLLGSDGEAESRHPIHDIVYVGDLAHPPYSTYSEDGAFDALLGLRSCLFIPVVGDLLARRSARERVGAPKNLNRRPLGGVLVAANRRPYGLRPHGKCDAAYQAWQEAKNAYSENAGVIANPMSSDSAGDQCEENSVVAAAGKMIDDDRNIARAIVNWLQGGSDESRETAKISAFTRCVGGLYLERSKDRTLLRSLFHPVFAKSVARAIKQPSDCDVTEEQIHKVLSAANSFIEQNPTFATAPDNIDGKVGECFQHGVNQLGGDLSEQQRESFRRPLTAYVVGQVWRDLRLPLMTSDGLPEDHSTDEQAQPAERKHSSAVPFARSEGIYESGQSYDEIVRTAAARAYSSVEDLYEKDSYTVPEFIQRLLDELLDDVRDSKQGAFTVFEKSLSHLAPVDDYVQGLSEIQSILGSVRRQQFSSDLAHSLQVWLLGLWILKQPVMQVIVQEEEDTKRAHEQDFLDQIVVRRIAEFITTAAESESRLPDKQTLEALAALQTEADDDEEWTPNRDMVAMYWGLVAGLHDVAVPVQRFSKWCKRFFEHYFGQAPLLPDNWEQRGGLDIFDHPRFPIYKNAIIGLHTPRQRDWLDVVFCQQFARRFDHAIAGALILLNQLSSPKKQDSAQQKAWRKWLHDDAVRMSTRGKGDAEKGESDAESLSPEQCLFLPAYFGHAIALSHLQELKRRWGRRPQSDNYYPAIAERFEVSFDQFPLTYLLGLCEMLTQSNEEMSAEWANNSKYDLDKSSNAARFTSPFYVTKVDSLLINNHPAIRVTLNLWQADYASESAMVCSRTDLVNLYTQIGNRLCRSRGKDEGSELFHEINDTAVVAAPDGHSDSVVYVYDDAKFKQMLKDAERNESGNIKNDWGSVDNRTSCLIAYTGQDSPLVCSRSAYQMVRIYAKLLEFNKHYKCRSCLFQIRFVNVEESDGRHFEVILGGGQEGDETSAASEDE